MTDLISRADAVEAVAQEWLSEASAESPYVNDDDIGEYRKLAEELFEDVPSADAEKPCKTCGYYNLECPKGCEYSRPSADAVSEDTQTKERARFVARETELAHIEAKLENAEKRLQGACTANFVAEQLERLSNMTDEERWDFFIKFFSPSSDAVSRVDCTDFLYWLIDEVMDEENWELNAVADGEIICRKLKKLGLLESKNGYYHDNSRATEESLRNAYYDGFNTASIEAQNVLADSVSVVRCKDCRYYSPIDENIPYLCEVGITVCNKDDFCSYGERREP